MQHPVIELKLKAAIRSTWCPIPNVLVGDQSDPRSGPNRSGGKYTSGPLTPANGGNGDFQSDVDALAGGTRPWQKGDSAPQGSLVGANGIWTAYE